ncbi:MAG: hypothetical protein HY317_03785, partial [Acidobacteria bacterium]|nr:hypothetical protein [Acidobacteriota bacterium]
MALGVSPIRPTDRSGSATRSPRGFDSPFEAAEFFARKRAPIGETQVPSERYATARRQMAAMPLYSTARRAFVSRPGRSPYALPNIGTWGALGPGNIGGRTRGLVIDPGNPNVMYAGGVSGGVWKTTNGGTSWAALNDLMGNLSIATLAMSPFASQTILAGTGEGFFFRGDGIFKTTNGGSSWTQIAATAADPDFYFVHKILYSPQNSGVVYAATWTGVFQSTDGGTTWNQILDPDPPSTYGSKPCYDMAIRPDKPNDWLVAACGYQTQATVYRNTDALNNPSTWSAALSDPGMGRTSLAMAPSNPDVVYALSASISFGGAYYGGLHKVFRSQPSTPGDAATWATNWTTQRANTGTYILNNLLLSNPLLPLCYGQGTYSQGFYDSVIAVDPLDATKVWVGGIDLFRSDDSGMTWGLVSYWWDQAHTTFAHADHHAIVFHPDYDGSANKIVFSANDGGVFMATDARAATRTAACDGADATFDFTSLNNNYGVTQFYYGAVYPDDDAYFGGTQDNGTIRSTDVDGANAWQDIHLGGDGGAVAVDPRDTQVLYAEYTGLSIEKSTNGGASWQAARSGISDPGFQFIAPFVMDPSDPDTLWTGGKYMWRTRNGASNWQKASAGFPYSVSAIAVAPSDPNYVRLCSRKRGRTSIHAALAKRA